MLILIGHFVLSACWELHSAGHFGAENNYKSAPGVNQGVWENSNSCKPSVSLGLQLSSCKKTHVKFVRRDTVALQEEWWALFHRGLPVYLLCYRFQIRFMCDTVGTSDSSPGFIPPGNPALPLLLSLSARFIKVQIWKNYQNFRPIDLTVTLCTTVFEARVVRACVHAYVCLCACKIQESACVTGYILWRFGLIYEKALILKNWSLIWTSSLLHNILINPNTRKLGFYGVLWHGTWTWITCCRLLELNKFNDIFDWWWYFQ